MAVVKLSKSGNALLFVDDEDNVYVTSVAYLKGILAGAKFPGLLTRLPNKAPAGKFKKSQILQLDGSKMDNEAILGSYAYQKEKSNSIPMSDLNDW